MASGNAPPGYFSTNPAVNQTGLAAIENQSSKDGVPYWVSVTIADAESGLNPNALGDYNTAHQPTSFGLFQLHQGDGQGAGYTASQLLNPTTNAQIGVAPIAAAYKQGVSQGLTGMPLLSFTADHSGHPTETGVMPSTYQTNLTNAYNTLEANGAQDLIGGGGYPAASSSSPGASQLLLVGLGGAVAIVGLWALLK